MCLCRLAQCCCCCCCYLLLSAISANCQLSVVNLVGCSERETAATTTKYGSFGGEMKPLRNEPKTRDGRCGERRLVTFRCKLVSLVCSQNTACLLKYLLRHCCYCCCRCFFMLCSLNDMNYGDPIKRGGIHFLGNLQICRRRRRCCCWWGLKRLLYSSDSAHKHISLIRMKCCLCVCLREESFLYTCRR